MKNYSATDDDLPENFFKEVKRPAVKPLTASELARELAVSLHYVPTKEEKEELERKQQRESQRDRREQLKEQERHYIRGKKIGLMKSWMRAAIIQKKIPTMTPWEQKFCKSLILKFTKYKTPKWITLKQFNSCRTIAARYLELPKN